MTTYGIGEFRMRNGDKAIVEHKDGYGTRCLVGTVCGHPRSWRITGHYLPDNESPFDLVAPWEEPAHDPTDTEMQTWLAEIEAGMEGVTPGDWTRKDTPDYAEIISPNMQSPAALVGRGQDADHIARTNPKRMAKLIGWLKLKGVMK